MRKSLVWAALVVGVGFGSLPGKVTAADLTLRMQPAPSPSPSSGWAFQATMYGWATSLDGDVGIRNLPSVKVDASFTDIFEHLDGAFMGSFLAKNGDWMILTDLVWSQLSNDATLKIANEPTVKFKQRMLIASAIAGYRLPLGNPDVDLSLTAGVRYQRLTAETTVIPGVVPISLTGSQTKDWVDPVVGLVLQYRIDERWFVNALADIGGFGVGSQLTSQGFLAVGYKWTEAISTAVGYRALYTNYKSSSDETGSFRYDTTMHGPFMSLAFHF